MTLHPQNDTVLCTMVNKQTAESTAGGITFQKQELPLYKIEAESLADRKSIFKVGDTIITDCIPTKANIDGTIYYIIKSEHIAGKAS